MRLATFNVLSGRSPGDDPADADGLVGRFAEAVRDLDADVLALQEVDRNQPRSHHTDLTSVAAEAMGAVDHRFVAAMTGTPAGTWVAATGAEPPGAAVYGIALLSRFPVGAWEVVRLPAVPVRAPWRWPGNRLPSLVRDEARVGLVARVDNPLGAMTVASTHLSFIEWWNGRQLRLLMRGLGGVPRPLVLMGDLNMSPKRAEATTGLRSLAAHLTFPAHEPREQIDHVLVDGPLEAVGSDARRTALSDHRALVVDLP